MILELTLVKTSVPFSPVGVFLERERVDIQSDNDASTEIIKFIGKCVDIISPMVADKTFIDNLQQLTKLSPDDFRCLRSMLSSYGLDIFTWCVSESEVNGDSVPADSYEYNIVDNLQSMTDSQKMCTKIVVPSESLSFARL